MDEQMKKRAEEIWEKQLARERRQAQEKGKAYHEPTFSIFLSSLSMQVMIAMGKVENPVTGKMESNYDQARFLIGTLNLIKEKTITNLTTDEETLLNDYLYNLRMTYVETQNG